MRIRLVNPADAPALAAIYDPIVTATIISFEERAPGADGMGERIAAITPRWPWLVADDGGVIGYAYASEHRARAGYRWSVDVSAYVAERARGRGVGSALYNALFPLLAGQRFTQAFAGVTLPNAASMGLHKALGFSEIGIYRRVGYKLGAWLDVCWLQRALAPAPDDPQDPLALCDVPSALFAAVLDK